MAYTPTNTAAGQMVVGQSLILTSATLTNGFSGTSRSVIFAVPKWSGQFWGQITFMSVLNTMTVLKANLEIDLSNTDANFVTLFTGLDLFNTPAQIFNLNGGNARYRFNFTTVTGTGADVYGLVG